MREQIEREIAELASALVRIPSANPPGDEDRIAEFAAQWLRNAGLEPKLVPLGPGRSSVVARLPGREDRSVVLCGHLDTVGLIRRDGGSPRSRGGSRTAGCGDSARPT